MRTRRILGLWLVLLLVTFSLASAAGASSAQTSYVANLSGAEEVPANNSPATGMATFEVSADGRSITYTVTVNNLDNLVMGHIHIGAKGANGPVTVNLIEPAQPGGGRKNGVVGQGTITADKLTGPLQGQPLSALINAMDSGNAYVNLHTNNGVEPTNQGPGDFPGGEIRGQIMRAAVPGLPNTGAGGDNSAFAVPYGWLLASAVLSLGACAVLELRRRARRAV